MKSLSLSCEVTHIDSIFDFLLLYKRVRFINFSATNKIDNLTCVIIHEISHVSIIVKRIKVYCSILWGNSAYFYIINNNISICILAHWLLVLQNKNRRITHVNIPCYHSILLFLFSV